MQDLTPSSWITFLNVSEEVLPDVVRDRRARWVALVAIFLVAFFLRAAWVAHTMDDVEAVMDGDGADYLDIATNLADGFGVAVTEPSPVTGELAPRITARRPPLFPLAASVLIRLFPRDPESGHVYLIVLLAQALLDALTVLLVYVLAREFGGARCGLVAAAGYALNFYVIQQTGQFMTETLFIFLQTAALVALCVGLRLESRAALAWGAGGLLLGLATLTRPVILFFPLWVVAWLLVQKRHEWRRWAIPAAAFLVVFALTLVPWSVRNGIRMGKPVIVSTVGGQTFYHSNHAQSDGKWFPLPVPEEASQLSEAERDGYYYRQGLSFVLSEPGTTVKNVAKKLLRLYYVFHPEYDFYFVITLLLALPGLWLYWRRGGDNWIPVLLVVYTTALCLVFWGTPRFRLPLLPCFLVFAGYWVAARIWTEEGGRPDRRYLAYAAAVVAANLLLAWWAQPVRALVKSLVAGG